MADIEFIKLWDEELFDTKDSPDYKKPIYKDIEPSINYTFADLFAGIGGMRLGFEQNGFECVLTCEWDKFCKKTYQWNFPDSETYTDPRTGKETLKWQGDITKVGPDDLPDFDVLVAGFPCQPFSLAGVSKRNSLGKKSGLEHETQGHLFFEIVRILKTVRPKAFLLENVKNLKRIDKGKTYEIILKEIDDLDYEIIFDEVVDGALYVPQHRERVFIVGIDRKVYHRNKLPKFSPALGDSVIHRLSEVLVEDQDPKYETDLAKATLTDKVWSCLQDHKNRHLNKGHGFGYTIADPNGVSRTLTARYKNDGQEILIAQKDKNPRKLIVEECKRLQGFDKEFVFPDEVSLSQRYKQLGNSVVVPLISELSKELKLYLNYLDVTLKEENS